MKFSKASVALLIIQLAIVSSIAAKYLYQRATCPRVWTRAAAFDPSLPMRGRYLSLRLTVDGCESTLPSAKEAQFQLNIEGVPSGHIFTIDSQLAVEFAVKLSVQDDKLVATRIPDSEDQDRGQIVIASPQSSCDSMRLAEPVNFYIPEHAIDPTGLSPGKELWIEVTLPPKGPPRPIQLAVKESGAWKPLAFQ